MRTPHLEAPWLMAALCALSLAACSDLDAPVGDLGSLRGDASPAVPPAVAGWSAAASASQSDAWASDAGHEYLLDSGDRLRIFVYGQPNLSRVYPVDQAGTITVPLIGQVHARSLTARRLEQVIGARLATRYVRDPEVTVDIVQHRPFFILGEVRNAGQYPYVSGLTVRSAVAIAGGFSERANEQTFQLTRAGGMGRFDVSDGHVVLPGDTIYVYERYF